jgi:curli production assembly/transport component CsgG
MQQRVKIKIITIAFIGFLASCSPWFYQPAEERRAELGPETPLKKEMMKLPEPEEKIVVAVYKFTDQTGQYKPSETVSTWSTAVTQGATNILIRALEESGWFIPIERENISNLLNERKIIRSSREQYEGNSGILLPPLLFAGVLIEGGIVSYESNVLTGGAGARYFGTDASAQYREDRVSIYLRAVSTANGKILKTVYTANSILSQEVSMGVFRYVKYKRLLEAETGYTYNEPTDMAITEAIEKAVYSLIIEGILDNLWNVKNPEDKKSPLIQQYLKEKEENREEDLLGRKYGKSYRGKGCISFTGGGQWYNGDYSGSKLRGGGEVSLGVALKPSLYLEAAFGPKVLNIKNVYEGTDLGGNLGLRFIANTHESFSPFIKAGIGTLYNFDEKVGLSDKKFIPYLSFEGGVECLLSRKFSLTGGFFFNQFLHDTFDGSKEGTHDDSFYGFDLGFRIYF